MARSQEARGLSLAAQRQLVGVGMIVMLLGMGYWTFASDGIPVWFGPSASAATKAAGQELFVHEWTANDPLASGDGLGPVFNATSCVACHFQGGVGGGGDRSHNATQFEVLPNPGKHEYISGVIHTSSVNASDRESPKMLKSLYPTIKPPPPPPPPPGHCGYIPPPTPPTVLVHTQTVQTTALFGAGWVDRISSKAIINNYRRRATANTLDELSLKFDQVPVGRVRMLADGRVGKFGWKAQFATLEEFVAAACANELGLGTPDCEQAQPFHKVSSGTPKPDLTKRQFRELVAFVDTLPKPVEVPNSESERGKELFKQVGCAKCHVPDMGGVQGVYSDFLLYTLDDPSASGRFDEYGPEPPPEHARPSHVPPPQEWKTQPLWGVADSAPYMHDGSATTLGDAIQAHRGDAKGVTAAFNKLSKPDQQAVIRFLESLKAPADAVPVSKPSSQRLASR